MIVSVKIKKPSNIADEVASISALSAHYDNVYLKSSFERLMFNIVIKSNKTFVSLLTGALTGFSINLLTGLLEIGKLESISKMQYFIVLSFALILNTAAILFASRVSFVQEAANSLRMRPNVSLTLEEIRDAENNLVYAECYKKRTFQKVISVISIISLILTLTALCAGNIIIQEVITWLG